MEDISAQESEVAHTRKLLQAKDSKGLALFIKGTRIMVSSGSSNHLSEAKLRAWREVFLSSSGCPHVLQLHGLLLVFKGDYASDPDSLAQGAKLPGHMKGPELGDGDVEVMLVFRKAGQSLYRKQKGPDMVELAWKQGDGQLWACLQPNYFFRAYAGAPGPAGFITASSDRTYTQLERDLLLEQLPELEGPDGMDLSYLIQVGGASVSHAAHLGMLSSRLRFSCLVTC